MSKTKWIMWVTLLLFLSTALSFAAQKEDPPGKGLFETGCGKCHSIDRAKTKKKSREEWETTVKRMKKQGAAISDDEVKLVVDYLAGAYKK